MEDPKSPLGIFYEDIAMIVSKENQRASKPEIPTLAWEHVAERIRRRK
jgi:hypothetical protein